MGFPFAWVCDLLEDLGKLACAPLLENIKKKQTNDKIVAWLRSHCNRLNAHDTDADAVILTFKPETKTDRDYGLDARSLEQIIARALNLPRKHVRTLQMWRQGPVRGDLALCVEKVLEDMNESKERVVAPFCVNQVTTEHIDKILLAISNSFSSTSSQGSAGSGVIEELGRLYRTLRFREAKWLTRLILKDFGHIRFPDELDCGPDSRYLPRCVLLKAKFQTSIPELERRDGPGQMRLGAAMKAYENFSPHFPTKPEPASSASTARAGSCAQVIANRTPTRLVSLEGCPTPSATAPGSVLSSNIVSAIRHAQVTTDRLTRATPIRERPTPPTTAPEIVSSATTTPVGVWHQQTIACNTPIRMVPLGERQDAVNHQSPIMRKGSTLSQFLSQGENICTPGRKSHRTNDGMRSGQQSTHISNVGAGIPRGGEGQSLSAPLLSICGSGKCQLTETTCPLANCIFLLAPCIAKIPWVTNRLLKWHGSCYVLSAKSFSQTNFHRRCLVTGKLYRKVILVESHNMEQTVDFLSRVERLTVKKGRGQKQPVEVYDWRILESIAKVDRGKECGHKSWSKYRLCEI